MHGVRFVGDTHTSMPYTRLNDVNVQLAGLTPGIKS